MAYPAPLVFVVDDDAGVRRSLVRLLGSVGLPAESFDSAQGFLDRPEPDGPACLVLDVRMPGLSGLDLQERLRGTRGRRSASAGSGSTRTRRARATSPTPRSPG